MTDGASGSQTFTGDISGGTITDLSPDTPYDVSIVALGVTGQASAASNTISVTTLGNVPAASFTDVPMAPPHVFRWEMSWLASTGYGTPPNVTFRPRSPVLREQMAAFLYRHRQLD